MSVGLWDPDGDKHSGTTVEDEVIDSFLALSSTGSFSTEDLEKAGVASQQAVMKLGVDARKESITSSSTVVPECLSPSGSHNPTDIGFPH
jgi:hypothetical protein